MWWFKETSVGNPLRKFWRGLRGSVHPADMEVLKNFPEKHTLELKYPPPAFVGDIMNARVFILYANGGYDEEDTGEEFIRITEGAYRERLHNPVPCDDYTHPYWLRSKTMSLWLRTGKAAVVNAMAYRSKKLSAEPVNQALADLLPSVKQHREWLRTHLLPAAAEGKIFVHFHRWAAWGLSKGEHAGHFIRYSDNPGYRYMSERSGEEIERFLGRDLSP